MADRTPVTAPDAPPAAGPYSHAIRVGQLLFCSGQVPLDPATGALVDGGAGARTTRCLENLQLVAGAAGGHLHDAVRCTIYLTDLGAWPEVNAAYGAFFEGVEPPARVTVGVAALPLGADVEIDAIVAL